MKNPDKTCASYGPGRPSETAAKAFRRVFAGIDEPERWTPLSTAVAWAAAPPIRTVASSPDGGSAQALRRKTSREQGLILRGSSFRSEDHPAQMVSIYTIGGGLLLALLAVFYVVFRSGSENDESSSHKGTATGSESNGGYVLDERSPDGQYRVRTAGPDQAVVLEHTDNGTLWTKELQRPNGLSVSNDGTVIVENWGSSNPDLISEFLAFDREGDLLLEEGYDALVRSSGLAADGTVAWLVTANAAASSESGAGDQLFVYDLNDRSRILKTDPPMMDVERVETSGPVVDVRGDGFHCRYEDGEMLNPESFRWEKEERELAEASSPNKVAGVAKRRVERADQLSEEQIRSTIKAARTFDGSGSDRTWAKLWRRKGELHEHLGEHEQALSEYEKALSLDEDAEIERNFHRLQSELDE